MRLDRIKNEVIRDKVGVASIDDKLTDTRIRWFNVKRKSIDAPVRRFETINVPQCRRVR